MADCALGRNFMFVDNLVATPDYCCFTNNVSQACGFIPKNIRTFGIMSAIDLNTQKLVSKCGRHVNRWVRLQRRSLIYKSPATGKQYVLISAGGMSHSPDVGDYIIPYALPD